MTLNHCLYAVAGLSFVALASCSTQPATTSFPVSVNAGRPDNSLSGKLFQEVNQWRGQQGAKSLRRHPGLDRLAQEHCEYLRQHRGSFGIYGANVSHYGFEGRADVAKFKYNMAATGENVVSASGAGSNPSPTLVKLWENSPGHKHNMETSWTHTGVGVVVDSDGTIFATQVFGTQSYSHASMTDPSRPF